VTEDQTTQPAAAPAEVGPGQSAHPHGRPRHSTFSHELRERMRELGPEQADELSERLRNAPLTRLIGLAGQAVGHTYRRLFAEEDGLSPGAAAVLNALAWGRGPGIAAGEPGRATHADLARRCLITPATLTGIVSTLEKAGYVRRERDQADRRVVWLLTTDEGLVRAKRITDRAVDAHCALVPALTPELESAIRGFLITVIENDLAIVQENPPVPETELRRPQC
jgi:MarR family transcriptional regulator, organic hydroperoxide resistance regulator